MRVAVIGAGISGLAAAHVLARTHDVTVFEAGAKPGGHTNTVRVDTEHETHWVDTGFIVFNDRNYPNFERLLGGLGVPGQASNMSFSVTDQTGDFEYASTSANGLFAKRAHLATPWFLKMVADVRRFQNEARALLHTTGDGPSLGDWLQERRYSRPFTDRPKWRTVAGGSHRYVEAITAPLGDRLRLATPVAAVRRHDDHVAVTPRGGEAEHFDEVVLATHSDQALALLED